MESETTRYKRGQTKRAEAGVETGPATRNNLGDLERYIIEFAYGDIYSRPGLELRERVIISVAILAALAGRETQLRMHIKSALNFGISMQELEEIILQTIPFMGFPTAMNALNVLSEFKEEAQ